MNNGHGEILAFSTKDCTYCRISQPHVDKYAEKHGVAVRKVNAQSESDEAKLLCEHYNIQSVPVVVLGHGSEDTKVLRGFQQIMNYIRE